MANTLDLKSKRKFLGVSMSAVVCVGISDVFSNLLLSKEVLYIV